MAATVFDEDLAPMRLAFPFLLLLFALTVPAAAEPQRPQSVVSINLCTDIFLLLLAEREQIASVSFLAADSEDSPVAEAASGLPVNGGTIEEIVAARPDLVLAHELTPRFTLSMLERLGLPVVTIGDGNSFETVRDNLRTVAAAVGAQKKAETLIAAFDRELRRLKRPLSPESPRAVAYRDQGTTSGAGSMIDTMLRHAGLHNVAAELGLGSFGALPLETLVAERPDLIVLGVYRPGAPSQARAILSHDAIERYVDENALAVEVPALLWTCGTPFVTRIVETLAAARDGLVEGRWP